ncbi:MAG: SMC family ATPase [Nitrososphaera sp.]|jgi:exonuclease SbcC
MIIKKLEIEGFKIIGDPIKVTFSETGKTAIAGRNETGKSTLLDSIEFALYGLKQGQGSSREDIITWGKEKARVLIQFTVAQQEYILQREVRKGGGHNVKLMPIVDGVVNKTDAITNIRQVEEKIEELLGLDRHAFSKLIYIKQKDLDALKDLQKAGREQLLNKVMGIEVFDQAIGNVKLDLKILHDELTIKENEMIQVGENKEAYASRLKEKELLQNKITNDLPRLDSLRSRNEDMQRELAVYEWHAKLDTLNKLAGADKTRLEDIQKEQKKLSEKQETLSRYNAAIEKYKPQIDHLQEILTLYKTEESEKQRTEKNIGILIEKQKEMVRNGHYSPKEESLLSGDLTKEKQLQLKRFAVFLVAGLSLIAVAFAVNLLIIAAGIAFIIVSIIAMRGYQRADNLFAKSAEIKSISTQIEEAKREAQQAISKYYDSISLHSFQSSDAIQSRVSDILASIKKETGVDSMEGLFAVAEQLDGEINRILMDDPSVRLNQVLERIDGRKKEIDILLGQKPDGANTTQYDEERFATLKKEQQKLDSDYNELYAQIGQNKALLGRIQQELIALRPDYERYPQLEAEILETKRKVHILDRVAAELSETSKELRNKVIPSARFFINKILPLLTNDRYSDFDITDDLKFKVHTIQAGDYKQREVFSGGTQDQFLIALRLAFTQSILNSRTGDDRHCLLMDESISSSDDLRKQGIFEVLDVMRDTFSQILIIAHEDISSFANHNIILSRNENGFTDLKVEA